MKPPQIRNVVEQREVRRSSEFAYSPQLGQRQVDVLLYLRIPLPRYGIRPDMVYRCDTLHEKRGECSIFFALGACFHNPDDNYKQKT